MTINYADYDSKISWRHRDIWADALAKRGYTYKSEAIRKEYQRLRSSIKVTATLPLSHSRIRFHLNKMGAKLLPKGGNEDSRGKIEL